MRIIQSLAFGEIWLHLIPHLYLTCIREQHTNNGATLCRFLYRKEGFARHPSVVHGLVIGLALTLSNDDIKSVIPQIAGLTRSLNTISKHGNRFTFQHLMGFFQRKLLTGDYRFGDTTKIHFCHNVNLLNP